MGRAEHMRQSMDLPSPFSADPEPDDDVLFAAEAIARFGPYVDRWRLEQMHHVNNLRDAVQPLTMALRKKMPPSVLRVAAKKDPGFMALFVVLLRWPDKKLPNDYVYGHRLVGHLLSSHLFFEVNQDIVDDYTL